MRINGPSRPAASAGAARARGPESGGAAFALGESAAPAASRPAAGALPAAGLDALIALQMVDDPTVGRRRGVKRGRAMLDALDGLKLSLLSGRVPAPELAGLLASVSGRERDSGDPRLEGLLDQIELRARVELAKLERRTA